MRITRRGDWIRLGSLLPLLILAGFGRTLLHVDAENLAMKAVGTPTEATAEERARVFGDEERLLLLVGARAPHLLDGDDEGELDAWIDALRARSEVAELLEVPSPNPGERCLGVTLRRGVDGHYADVLGRLAAFAHAEIPPTYELAIAGVPRVELAIAGEMSAERARILPLLVAGLALVLFVVYRNLVLVLGALLAPLAGAFFLDGLQGLLGMGIDPVSSLLGPAVLTVGVASSVHVLEAYRRALRSAASVERASRGAARGLRVPLLLTSVTTVAGFLGLLASPVPAVRRFGLLASAGVLIAVAITLLCLPSLLRILHRPTRPARLRARAWPAFDGPALERWAGAVVGTALVVVVVCAFGSLASRVDNDPLHVLEPHHPARRDAETVAARLGGSEAFELFLPPGGPTSPLAVARLGSDVVALDGVVALAGFPRLASTGQRLLTFLLAPAGSAKREALFDRAEALARAAGWSGAGATGLAVRMARDSAELIRGQRRGVLLTLVILWIVLSLGLRSARLGLLGLVPNALPVIVIQGVLGFADEPLSVASSMIGTVMLGLVVDDTIHLLLAYRRAAGPPLDRVRRALSEVARPILVTSLVLCVGFAATLAGQLEATRTFGLLAVATLSIALIADLVLLPALLVWDPPLPLHREPEEVSLESA